MQILIKKIDNGYMLQVLKGPRMTDICFQENENTSALSACLQYVTQVLRLGEHDAAKVSGVDPYQPPLLDL